eukprot:CAMPEP_0196997228 /NCGR_PEP_ID=MMETSP1380-20130617/2899_1 /TAXON_ID=5936 /ORGANISM="Euplotes crassus, Strain CT5" /LENGTH=240 /DNA_ID=CAMNT_0042413401 /DNA_START=51 /DNA_END=773 /DNA_ORIENTATION=+
MKNVVLSLAAAALLSLSSLPSALGASCPTQIDGAITWPETAEGMEVVGDCQAGYTGHPIRFCNAGGVWDSAHAGSCQPLTCRSTKDSTSIWPEAAAGEVARGKCSNQLLSGSPTRICQLDGTWGPVDDPCTVASQTCPGEPYTTAMSFPATPAGTLSFGICAEGYTGFPLRMCGEDGQWSEIVTNTCQRSMCPEDTSAGFTWPATGSLDQISVSCPSGSGSLTRFCNASGAWEQVESSCA